MVDDDERVLRALSLHLRPRATVLTARCAAEAREQLRLSRPSVTVVDVYLGTESGLDLVRELRSAWKDIKIAAVSAEMTIALSAEAIRAGADDVFAKPFTCSELAKLQGDLDIWRSGRHETPSLARNEWEFIRYQLRRCEGNVSEVARRLGIGRTAIRRKLKKTMPPW